MGRYCLADTQWAKIEPLYLGKAADPGRTGGDWRDLAPSFGNWNSVFKRFRDWA
jgi:transposase